jgi:hypothetical protein
MMLGELMPVFDPHAVIQLHPSWEIS